MAVQRIHCRSHGGQLLLLLLLLLLLSVLLRNVLLQLLLQLLLKLLLVVRSSSSCVCSHRCHGGLLVCGSYGSSGMRAELTAGCQRSHCCRVLRTRVQAQLRRHVRRSGGVDGTCSCRLLDGGCRCGLLLHSRDRLSSCVRLRVHDGLLLHVLVHRGGGRHCRHLHLLLLLLLSRSLRLLLLLCWPVRHDLQCRQRCD